ncbi:hypothetical protein Scep_021162 [Stephania cephalantha]|uniref:Uncharacterized protein n=1 Tax=Stephania cephalantha TaxID=152367 RepID=A0AAP0FAA9_9MAGN
MAGPESKKSQIDLSDLPAAYAIRHGVGKSLDRLLQFPRQRRGQRCSAFEQGAGAVLGTNSKFHNRTQISNSPTTHADPESFVFFSEILNSWPRQDCKGGRYIIRHSEETMNAATLKSVEFDEFSILDEYLSEPEDTLEVSSQEPNITIAQNKDDEVEKEIGVIFERLKETHIESEEDQPLVLVKL